MIIVDQKLPEPENRLTQILNGKIRCLDIKETAPWEQLLNTSYGYFPNLRYMNLRLDLLRPPDSLKETADMCGKLLMTF